MLMHSTSSDFLYQILITQVTNYIWHLFADSKFLIKVVLIWYILQNLFWDNIGAEFYDYCEGNQQPMRREITEAATEQGS